MSDTPRTDAEHKYFFSSISGERDPSRDYVPIDLARQLERELNEALKWKEEDPRMLREQIRVADVAFNGLHERHKALEVRFDEAVSSNKLFYERNQELQKEVESLKAQEESWKNANDLQYQKTCENADEAVAWRKVADALADELAFRAIFMMGSRATSAALDAYNKLKGEQK